MFFHFHLHAICSNCNKHSNIVCGDFPKSRHDQSERISKILFEIQNKKLLIDMCCTFECTATAWTAWTAVPADGKTCQRKTVDIITSSRLQRKTMNNFCLYEHNRMYASNWINMRCMWLAEGCEVYPCSSVTRPGTDALHAGIRAACVHRNRIHDKKIAWSDSSNYKVKWSNTPGYKFSSALQIGPRISRL